MNPKNARIQLAGASGTGKTTIAQKMSAQFGLTYRGSVNREIQAKHGVTHKTQGDMTPADLWDMQQILSAAQLANLGMGGSYISDRSVLDGFVYAMQVSGSMIGAEWLQDQMSKICEGLAGIDLLVIVPWPAPFEVPDDGFRKTIPGEQMAFHSMLLGLLVQMRKQTGVELPTFGTHFIPQNQWNLDDRTKGIVSRLVEGDIIR